MATILRKDSAMNFLKGQIHLIPPKKRELLDIPQDSEMIKYGIVFLTNFSDIDECDPFSNNKFAIAKVVRIEGEDIEILDNIITIVPKYMVSSNTFFGAISNEIVIEQLQNVRDFIQKEMEYVPF